MANLSITRAWNETAEFVRREAGLLFPISFMLLALPSALLEAVTPPPPMPNEPPEAGLWLLLIPVVVVGAFIGNVAISYLALKPGASVGEALSRGARRMLSLLGAAFLIGFLAFVLFFALAIIAVLVVPGAMSSAGSATPTAATITAILIAFAVIMPVAFYFLARLLLMTPIAAAEEGGPLHLINRSWSLTAGNVWKLVGFLVLVTILLIVLTAAIQAVAGILFALLAGPIEHGSTSAWLVIVVMSLVTMVVSAYLMSCVARIYAQLSGAGTPDVFA